MTFVFTFFTITLRFLSATERDCSYRDLAEIARKPHSLVIVLSSCNFHDLRIKIARCLRTLFGQNDHLKSRFDLTISVRCPYRDRAIQQTCDVSTGYVLTIFRNLSKGGVIQDRRGYDARESVR